MTRKIDPAKLADVKRIVGALTGLPKETLFYIAGYAEGSRDKAKLKQDAKENKPPDYMPKGA